MTNDQQHNCRRCKGEGSHPVAIQWSDGLGMGTARCGVCDGTGVEPTYDELLTAREDGRNAAAELARLRRCVALYFATSEGHVPSPPLKGAPRPSPHRSTWASYLRAAAELAPRFSKAEWIDYNRHVDESDAQVVARLRAIAERNGEESHV